MSEDFSLGFSGLNPGGYSSGRGREFFPEPFFDMASLAMPQTMPTALRWCEFILESQGIYRSALERTVRYFLTDVDVKGEDVSDDEKGDFKNYLVDELNVLYHAGLEQMDEACYGNSFYSVIEGFTRYFRCPKCRDIEVTFDTITTYRPFAHQWNDYGMHATCPKCAFRGKWLMNDKRGGKAGGLSIKRWSPHEIQIICDDYSHQTAYVWVVPEKYRREIREGKLECIKHAPPEVIEAVRTNTNIRFADDYLFHGATHTFSGIRSYGWGVPRVLVNFRQAWYVQLLHRFNEAIALDYVVPMRLITPDAKAGAAPESTDPLLAIGGGAFGSRIENMIRDHRRDPGSAHWLPFPVKYQALGGEASQLAPYQLMDQGIDTLLNSCNVPVEFYKMTLSMQAAQPALRLFESTHREIPHNINRFLKFVSRKVCHFKDWAQCTAYLIPTTILDDISKQMPKLQMMASGQVSPQTGLNILGLDAKEEYEKTLDFSRFQQETQQQMQEEMEVAGLQQQIGTPPVVQYMQQQQAAAQGGGQPAPGARRPRKAPPPASPPATRRRWTCRPTRGRCSRGPSRWPRSCS